MNDRNTKLDSWSRIRPAITAGSLAFLLAAALPGHAQQGSGGSALRLFEGGPDFLADGKLNFNARLRYEFVDQDGVPAITDDAHAFTLRSRLGFTTAPVWGFQAMLEGEKISVIGSETRFNASGTNNRPNRPVVADVPATELNQGWLSYTYGDTTLKGGRQRIVLDNHRFIGDVGWRQNQQTYDAISLSSRPLADVTFFYAWLWEVNRVFGDSSQLASQFRDFDSDSHIMNLSWSGLPWGKVTTYAYLLDFDNSLANSSATYGASFVGAQTLDQDRNLKVTYHVELARQTDYANQPLSYSAWYQNVQLGGEYGPVQAGIGYEVLGSDSTAGKGFATPLATLHGHNGWADVFLSTPNDGLRNLSAWVGTKLPGGVPVRFIYHDYDPHRGSGSFGREYNVVASRTFAKHWTFLAKYAYYDGKDAAPPALTLPKVSIHKAWAQLEFNF